MKVGFEVNNNKRVYTGGYYGNGNINIFRDYNTRTVDWNGDGTSDVVLDVDGFDLQRISIRRYDTATTDGTKRLAAYFSDTISAGRFNFNIGFRFDHAKDFREEALFRGLWLPGQEVPTSQMANYAALTEDFFGSAAAVNTISALFPDSVRPDVAPIKTLLVLLAAPRRDLRPLRRRQDGPQGRLHALSRRRPGDGVHQPVRHGRHAPFLVG